ncbi:MAG TPA: hypothetical protein VEU97_09850 [Ktedonobacteraceae bacterium]|nr:hypothetical protein [Ktedonobacteraceae bacterium]
MKPRDRGYPAGHPGESMQPPQPPEHMALRQETYGQLHKAINPLPALQQQHCSYYLHPSNHPYIHI